MARFWKLYRNKICAIAFSVLGIVCYLSYYLVYGLAYGFGGLTSNLFTVFSALLTLVIYCMLLITNIRNDNAAYTAVLLFVFLIAWRLIWSFLPSGSNIFSLFSHVDIWLFLVLITSMFALSTSAMGALFYIWIFRYRLRRTTFARVRLFGWLFVASLATFSLFNAIIIIGHNGYPAWVVLELLPNISIAVAVMFTMNRLRTY